MIRTLELPVSLSTTAESCTLRRASEDDLGALIRLLADDTISTARGDRGDESDDDAYRSALRDILADTSNELLVVVGDDLDEPLATMQLTRIPGMARRGATRLLLEAVRVRSDCRSTGIGTAMMRWVTETAAPAVGAPLVQLTSDDARRDAHRFYERLGFIGSHRGFKFTVA